ncbi:hypothetical protein LCGC14_1202740 [marine sediment metagenome]|uniref:Uncharacterized protein n=1 Tax=marine sediment metagenome TaxID=412755 RepID=A0A0F9M3P5_9ZZZZ
MTKEEEAKEQHRSDWIEAEYETMGWEKPVDVAIVSLIEEKQHAEKG